MFKLIMQVFGLPLGYLMWAMYQVVHSYGWAIILFTIVTKLLLIPLAVAALAGGGIGLAVFLKHKHENGEEGSE